MSPLTSNDPTELRKRTFARAGCYLLIAESGLILVCWSSAGLRWYGLTIIGTAAVLALSNREARAYGMRDLSNPVVMSLAASVLFFGLLGAPNVIGESRLRQRLLVPNNGALFRALGTVGLSMACLWLGASVMQALLRRRPLRLEPLKGRVRSGPIVWVVAIGTTSRFLLLLTGNLGYQGFGGTGDLTGYANWLATANDLLPFAAGLLLVDWFTTRLRSRLIAIGYLFIVEAATSLVSGVKGLIVLLLVYLAVIAVRAGRKPSLRMGVVSSVLFLLVIAPTVEGFRSQIRREGSPGGFLSRITAPLSLVGAGSNASTLETARTTYENSLLEEQSFILDVALIQAKTPSVYPHENGRRWFLAPLAATIPRAIWPTKPSLSNGGEIAVRYGGAAAPTTSMPATMAGDAWIQFGWYGVIGGSFVLGAVYRWVYVWIAIRRNPGWTVALCFVVAQLVFSAGLDIPALFTSAGRDLVIYGLIGSRVFVRSEYTEGLISAPTIEGRRFA